MYFEDIAVGQSAEMTRAVTQQDINMFAEISGDVNPVHLDPEYAAKSIFKGPVAHGMLSASMISAVAGTKLPGEGSVYMGQTLKFRAPVRPGQSVRTVLTITQTIDRGPARGDVVCETKCFVGETLVVEGEATLMVPKRPVG